MNRGGCWRLCVLACALVSALGAGAAAQVRVRRVPPPLASPPAELSIRPMAEASSPWLYVLEVHAHAALDLAADRRLLRFEILPIASPGARRRTLRCEHPDRPARVAPERIVHLEAGQRWAEWVDLREHCWGRALEAIRTGARLLGYFGPPRRGRGFAVRVGDVEHRELGPVEPSLPPLADRPTPEADAPLRIVLEPADVASVSSLVLRVAITGGAGPVRRAYVRPDRVRFHVRAPDGSELECRMPPGGGAPQPDLFQRLGPRSGPRWALEARAYCPPDALAAAGVYEVTPTIVLEHDGVSWGIDAITGTFRGTPALVRIRRGERGYVERPIGRAGPS